eukprot:4767017-Amphidinium_carterae.1
MDIIISNGNHHMPYVELEQRAAWDADEVYMLLREQYTLPRLLAGFSLFDHNFQKARCALSMRNYAVWGAEYQVKKSLLQWQGNVRYEPLTSLQENADTKAGQFHGVIELLRSLRWQSVFAPHVGEFLDWAWRTPGLEIGIRLTTETSASKEFNVDGRVSAERDALMDLANRLSKRPQQRERIAAARNGLNWRSYGLGSLEKFVRKYTGWFGMEDDVIILHSCALSSRPLNHKHRLQQSSILNYPVMKSY